MRSTLHCFIEYLGEKRNGSTVLPYSYGLEIQDYPTDRLHLSFIVDNSIDDSLLVLSTWIEAVRSKYHGIELEVGNDLLKNTKQWSEEHHRHFVQLRQNSVDAGRVLASIWSNRTRYVDSGAIHTPKSHLCIRHRVSQAPIQSELHRILPVSQ
ncbi:hypothetical protein FGIG_02562 [Fasciola gigantica]|uniref:Uncharacterized protein n=1 Tax=Fasciola gigantica TaxID=46835 RepID=A0A504YS27_FASGI|nr:hypothetical protein FGIG_02562 [Fasciola gigantica]